MHGESFSLWFLSLYVCVASYTNRSGVVDYESSSGSYTLSVTATDAGGLSVSGSVTVAVSDVNEAPTVITLTPSTIAENSAVDTVVGTLSTTDADGGQTFTYTLGPQNPAGLFKVCTANAQRLCVASGADFEVAQVATVEVTSTDSGTPPLAVTKVRERCMGV